MGEGNPQSGPDSLVLVAVKDRAIVKDILAILRDDHKITTPHVVEDGEAAWAMLKSGGVVLVIMDWDLDRVPSVVLFNRIRQDKRYFDTPVMVIERKNQRERMALIKDYPPVGISEGTFAAQSFSLKLGTLLKEAGAYQAGHAVLGNFAQAFASDPKGTQERLAAEVKEAPNAATLLNIAAKRLMDVEAYGEAERFLGESLRINPHNATTILLQARIYNFTGRAAAGLQIMSQHKYSAKDYARTLLEAELNLAAKRFDEARAFFAKAGQLEPASEKAKLGILLSDSLKIHVANNVSDGRADFQTLLGLAAEALAKDKKMEKGVELFTAVIALTQDSLARVSWMCDIAVFLAQNQRRPEALDWLKKAAHLSRGRVDRPAELIKTLTAAAA